MAAAAQYHVIAVQDWRGPQEGSHEWNVCMTRAEAEDLARDIIDADWVFRVTGLWDEVKRRYRPKYGDDWHYLLPATNVDPGWNAIFIAPCAPDVAGEPGEPWWTPARRLHAV